MRDTLEMAREAWAKAGEGWVDQNWYLDREKAFKELVELARADEREACAEVCEQMPTHVDRHNAVTQASAKDCAAAIRARGETK